MKKKISRKKTAKGLVSELASSGEISPPVSKPKLESFNHKGVVVTPYNGKFDGKGHKITGLKSKFPGLDNIGLFARLGPNAVVKNLCIEGAEVEGRSKVGVIAGQIDEGAQIINCKVNGSLITAEDVAGAITGDSRGEVAGNYVIGGNIKSNGKAGGVSGMTHGKSKIRNNQVINTEIVGIGAGSNVEGIAGEVRDESLVENNQVINCKIKKGVTSEVIEPDDYEDILKAIRNSGLSLEQSPNDCKELGEEALRNLIRTNLNTKYEGLATAETFRKKGKTDILILKDDKASFIAECKIWTGDKVVHEAIDQLFGYLIWRDCKASVILFNKHNASFMKIKDKIKGLLESYTGYIKTLDSEHGGEWRCKYHSPEDINHEVIIHVFLFNLYCKK
ncbi:hypothetical protein SMSP2_02073 [Limihaloglobus sulfuriphilus]|uniref:Uncharacterized protein n=1 Tax=Limihaloglobus sulfuriphilus TaxID=1851148 RepID=A0A1R7T5S6_9BACT|nr:hypothetical protein [Limihaloglobus sulfuriphilus]AQQ71696.1 hypothetical protein SMSP2_02073 [Limihaloglobus sulfuriphilus]